ncbi:MAG TPA: lamin tail domain-containing protein [Verrucomicrobiales bacterium]|nr:lamin tail domain-containing protein [Verrucomicrobiales bacterium]
MIRPLLCCLRAAWLLLVPVPFSQAFVLRIDFDDNDDANSSPQAGWTSVSQTGGANLNGTGIGLAITAVGSVTIDDRSRIDPSSNGGGAEADMWEDFIFANGSDTAAEGMDLVFTGLQPNQTYPVRLWIFDKGSPNARTSAWNGVTYTFNGSSAAPATLAEDVLTLNVTTSASGTLTLQGRAAVTGQPHNVFLNGLEIGDSLTSPTAPTDIMLAPSAIGALAPVGTVVGTLSSADPEAGDNHTYALTGGAGSTHNLLFTLGGIDGEEVRVAASLAAYGGQTLSIRARTTDQHGDSFEKALSITITNDSDGDSLDDTWELQYFPNLTAAAGSGNNDGDTLTNDQEETLGSDPTKTDTDGDTLPDHQENNTRVFNGSANPGTSPALADTDADGLRDDAEISGPVITNPNLADTDGDNYSDSVEISAGTDPASAASHPSTLLALRINEVLASNRNGLKDGYGGSEDWIEIFNPNATAVNLDNYYLTDDDGDLTKWSFPAVSIPAGGYFLVFASGRDTTDPQGKVHTNFSLADTGEYLALVQSDGLTIDSQFSPEFPRQFTDVSYGYHPSNGTLRFFGTPTPGAANNAGFDGAVADTAFSVNRGYYDTPFNLEITTPTPGATIRYTTDGSKPTASFGTVYSAPIPITGTTVVRAFAYRTGWLSTNVDTHTYLFLNQVIQQPAAPAYPPGLPSTWGTNAEVNSNDGTGTGIVPADYAMDQRVVNSTLPGYGVREALLAIPSMSITLPVADMFSSASGIWANTINSGPAWERECSLEMIVPDGASGTTAFQENCIVEPHGGSSRRPWRMQKHSLRVTFRSSVGPGTLNYPLFPDSPVTDFNKIILRACFTDSWGLVSWDAGRYRPNDSQYLRDYWMKELYRTMGQPSTYGKYVHLYINGLYMGLYNPSERVETEHLVAHYGGQESGWELNADFATPGPRWNAMMALTNYTDFPAYIDLANFADYMLLHIFADAEDWPSHNGHAATNPSIGFPYRFFVWDQEIVFDNHGINRIDSATGVGALFQKLRGFPEFRLLFADRVRKHLFNGGALTSAAAGQLYLQLASRIDKAIVAESARWGDTRPSMAYGSTIQQPNPLTNVDDLNYPPAPNGPNFYFTREQSWLLERDNIVNNYLPSLHNTANSYAAINKLKAKQLYPSTAAPDFSQHGGNVAGGFTLSITAPAGTVYYTLNGADPREAVTGNPVGTAYSGPVSLTQTATVKARARNGAEWSALTEAQFVVGTLAGPANLVISEICYNPPAAAAWEYIELMNISGGAVDLTGVQFTAGIAYTFAPGTVLAGGQRLVLASDAAAFAAKFPGVSLHGTYTGKLDNNGEQITLTALNGGSIRSFTWNDKLPWPVAADGNGHSLTLVAPLTNPDHALPENWRPSVLPDGTPGTGDSEPAPANPAGDTDGDGWSNLMEYALGNPRATAVVLPDKTPALQLIRRIGADSARVIVESSPDLQSWSPMPPESLQSATAPSNGEVTETWSAGPSATRSYMRARVQLR